MYPLILYICVCVASEVALVVKNLPASARDVRHVDLIPGSGRSPEGRRAWQPLENPMDRGVWWAKAHRVTKSWTQLNQFSTHAHIINYNLFTKIRIVSPYKCT